MSAEWQAIDVDEESEEDGFSENDDHYDVDDMDVTGMRLVF